MIQERSISPTKQRKPSFGKNGVPTPPGFEAHPERRHNGAWKKEDTPRFKLEQMMKLTESDLKNIVLDESLPYFERKLATAINKGQWKEIESMINQVYGAPKSSVDITSEGQPIPLLGLDHTALIPKDDNNGVSTDNSVKKDTKTTQAS